MFVLSQQSEPNLLWVTPEGDHLRAFERRFFQFILSPLQKKRKKCTLGLVKTWRVVKFSAVVLNLRIEESNGSSRKPSILRRTVATADFKGNVADFLGTKR